LIFQNQLKNGQKKDGEDLKVDNMTTLDCKIVKKGKWTVTKHVAGDLSFTYEVRPKDYVVMDRDGTVQYVKGFGIACRNMKDVNKAIVLCRKYGYNKAQQIWREKYMRFDKGYHFGYLKGKEAEHYAKFDDAYGDYALRLRKGKSQKSLHKFGGKIL